jgi:hypothetical protein
LFDRHRAAQHCAVRGSVVPATAGSTQYLLACASAKDAAQLVEHRGSRKARVMRALSTAIERLEAVRP